MGAILGGLAVAAIGAGVSAAGTAKNAKAAKKAAKASSLAENQLYNRQSGFLDDLTQSKTDKLSNLGDIFGRMESTGAFGDTDTLANLRKAQSDFSALAAGDFTGFESQLRKSMSDALVNTVGSGSPIGAYAGLAADTQLGYRQQGINTTLGISDYLSKESMNLLGTEFGIMDQGFEKGYELDRNRVTGSNAYNQQAAATEGVGLQALGTGVSQLGSGIASYGTYKDNMAYQNRMLDSGMGYVNQMRQSYPNLYNGDSKSGLQTSYRAPSSYAPSLPDQSLPPLNNPLDTRFDNPNLPTFDPDTQDTSPMVLPTKGSLGYYPSGSWNSSLAQVGRNIVSA